MNAGQKGAAGRGAGEGGEAVGKIFPPPRKRGRGTILRSKMVEGASA
jgi:hypothetical protein